MWKWFLQCDQSLVGCHDMDYVDNTDLPSDRVQACGEGFNVSTCRGDSLGETGWMATIADHEVKIFACKGGDTACIGPVTNTKCGRVGFYALSARLVI